MIESFGPPSSPSLQLNVGYFIFGAVSEGIHFFLPSTSDCVIWVLPLAIVGAEIGTELREAGQTKQ